MTLLPFASQVKAIVAGHIHQAFEGILAGIPILATPSIMCQLVPQIAEYVLDTALTPGMRIIDLPADCDELLSRVQRLPSHMGRYAASL